ncbi:MAG: preprotein translocase subunit SecE [Clostridia bacterium]|nr:preprotein translocase subunit SecE [Clostridia bacterium]
MANELKTTKKEEVKAVKKKENVFKKIGRFLKDYRGELKKITWPTPKQTLKNTGIVLLAMVVMGLFVGLLDLAFKEIIKGIGELVKLL